MTASEIISLVKLLRENGVTQFSSPAFRCRIEPLPKPRQEAIEALRETPPDERMKLLKEAEKDLNRDLYGATGEVS